MKKIVLLIFLYSSLLTVLTVISVGCRSSKIFKEDTVITFHVNSINKVNETKIKHGKKVTLSITDINKDLYDVSITPSIKSNNTEIPDALSLSSLALPPTILLGQKKSPPPLDARGGIGNALQSPNCGLGNINNSIDKLKRDILDAYKIFQQASESINSTIIYYNKLDVLQKECGKSYNVVSENVNTLTSNTFGFDTSHKKDIKSKIDSAVTAAKKSYSRINQSLDSIDNFLNYNSCDAKQKESLHDFTDREKENLSSIKDVYEKITDFEQTNQSQIIVDKLSSFNESNYMVKSKTIKAAKTDEISFDVSIKPKNWLPCKAIDTSFAVNLKVRGGLKVDFSTGIFGNFGNNNFHGNTYYLDYDSSVKKVNSGSRSLIPSVGALIHIYPRTGGLVSAGAAFGASIDFDLKLTNLHAGASVMFNTDNEILSRIAISGGAVWHYRKELITVTQKERLYITT